jgi:hypothetical protein
MCAVIIQQRARHFMGKLRRALRAEISQTGNIFATAYTHERFLYPRLALDENQRSFK